MPDLEYELRQLLLADLHLAKAVARRAQLQAMIEEDRSLGMDTTLTESVLTAMGAAIVEMTRHRELIAHFVRDMEEGTLPRSDRQKDRGIRALTLDTADG